MSILAVTAALLLAALASPAFAQKLAPGLWEHAMTMKSDSGGIEKQMAQMQQELAKLPPEQRKQMEQMMAGRGVGMGSGAPGQPTTMQVCLTPEQAARDEMPQHDGRCKQTSKERSGNKMRFSFTCSGEPPTRGEGEFTLDSAKAYSGRVVVDTAVKGKPERMEMQSRARWLSADCGSVKPRP